MTDRPTIAASDAAAAAAAREERREAESGVAASADAAATDGRSPSEGAERPDPTASSDPAVQVFTGTDIPEPGPAAPVSPLEDPRAAAVDAAATPSGHVAPDEAARTFSMTALLGSSLTAGLVGAGLALAAQALWLSPSGRLDGRLAQIEQRVGSLATQDVAAGERRFGAIETEIKAVDERLRAARQVGEAAAKRAEEALARPAPPPPVDPAPALAAVDARLARIEGTLSERAEALAALQSGFERRLADADGRLAGVERRLSESRPLALEVGLRLLAADRLSAALRDGQPLGPVLSLLARLKAEPETLSPLQRFADAAPPDAARLALDFAPLAARMRTENRPPESAPTDWSGKLIGLADQLVTIRPTGAAGDAEPAVARIETALAARDLPAAAAAWETLPTPARDASRDWAEALKARIAADAAARLVGARAVAAVDAALR